MKNKHWEAIHDVYTRLETLCGTDILPAETSDSKDETGVSSVRKAPPVNRTVEDLVSIRSEIRIQLDFLRATLSAQYSERDCYLILFPIVAQIDELIQTRCLSEIQTQWPLLQKELFEVDNAGETFFEIMDDILLKPKAPLLVYEVFYFCLKYGFQGRYRDHPAKIKGYLNKLEERLSLEQNLTATQKTAEETEHIRYFGTPLKSYLTMAGILIGAYIFLRILGKYL